MTEITELAAPGLRERVHWFELDRRDFLKLCGGGLLVCLASHPSLGQGRRGHEKPKAISAWLYIDAKGNVTVFTGKIETGQNVRTSLAQQVAEELRVPIDSISMVMGDTDLTPWDIGTFGSLTTPTMGPELRKVAASARNLLAEEAARQWSADAKTLTVADGRITNPQTGKSLTFGEITQGQKLTGMVEDSPTLTPTTEWKIAGTSIHKVDGRDFVTGKHKYPSDIVRPGMLLGKVLRPSGFHASLLSVDTSAAEKMPGVKVVHDGDFIGVAAPDLYTAEQALAAIKAEWNVPQQISNKEMFEYIRSHPKSDGEEPSNEAKSASTPEAHADVTLDQHYTVQYIAHAPLEPRAAVAEWENGKLTVWTGTQRPFAVRDQLSAAFRLSSSKVRVKMPDMGGAYGGKHTGECAVEAARLAKAAGKPVKLVWTREEEFTWAYFRPAGWIEIRSGANRDGKLVYWEFHNYNSGAAGVETPYDVPNPVAQYHPTDEPLRQGSYRALAGTANHFARESHMDELAHALRMDPLEFRLKNLSDNRLRAVFQAAADRFGWGKAKSTPERGFGIAGGTEKGGRVATCVEIAVDPTSHHVHLRRVVQAWESGAVVNPNGLRNQMSGAVTQGIGGAMFEAIQFNNGRILNPHFSQYRVPRFSDTPQIEIVLVDRKDLPSAGAGEVGIVGLAPAIGNAYFAATGTRLRDMPMTSAAEIKG